MLLELPKKYDFANICILMKLDVVFMEKDDNDFDVEREHTN